MYFLFKMGIFHCYVCLPEGKSPKIPSNPVYTFTSYTNLLHPLFLLQLGKSFFHRHKNLAKIRLTRHLDDIVSHLKKWWHTHFPPQKKKKHTHNSSKWWVSPTFVFFSSLDFSGVHRIHHTPPSRAASWATFQATTKAPKAPVTIGSVLRNVHQPHSWEKLMSCQVSFKNRGSFC